MEGFLVLGEGHAVQQSQDLHMCVCGGGGGGGRRAKAMIGHYLHSKRELLQLYHIHSCNNLGGGRREGVPLVLGDHPYTTPKFHKMYLD